MKNKQFLGNGDQARQVYNAVCRSPVLQSVTMIALFPIIYNKIVIYGQTNFQLPDPVFHFHHVIPSQKAVIRSRTKLWATDIVRGHNLASTQTCPHAPVLRMGRTATCCSGDKDTG